MHEGHHGILDGVTKDKAHQHRQLHVHSHDGGTAHSHGDGDHAHEHVDKAAIASSRQARHRWLAMAVVLGLFGALFLLISNR